MTESRSSNGEEKYLRVYENDGDGSFIDKTSRLNMPVDGFSTIVADFNNDGYDDIITTFEDDYAEFWQNNGSWYFSPS